jgi:predicted XRE-type DNA-binding protein
MQRKRFGTVWEALEDDPAEAANLAMRSELMIAIEKRVRAWKTTQAEAAARLGLTQPRLNDLLRGKLDKFSLDALVNLAMGAGLKVRLAIAQPARR